MSSGPAMSSRKLSTASEDDEPSSDTSTRLCLYTGDLLGGRRAHERRVERGVARTDQKNRHRGRAQDALGDAAEYEPPQTAAAVARHDDEVGLAIVRGLHDCLDRRPVPDGDLAVGDARGRYPRLGLRQV